MFSNIASRTISSTIIRTNRAPSIRFRYGASRDLPKTPSGPAVASQGAPVQPGESIYDFQIPQRWKRRPISEEEIEYINRGGPA